MDRALAIAVFILNTVPLEMQRRILNAAVLDGDVKDVLMLAVIYAGVVLSEGPIKLLINIYLGPSASPLPLATQALYRGLDPSSPNLRRPFSSQTDTRYSGLLDL